MSAALRRVSRLSEKRTATLGTIKLFDVMGPREFGGTMTTEEIGLDYMGDVVVAAGVDLGPFRKNPVLVDSHDTSSATNVIGTVPSVALVDHRIDFRAEFLPEGVSEKVDQICAAVKHGAINDVSIGFIPYEYKQSNEPPYGYIFTKWVLLELSVCAVGANNGAKITQRSLSGGGGYDDASAARRSLAAAAAAARSKLYGQPAWKIAESERVAERVGKLIAETEKRLEDEARAPQLQLAHLRAARRAGW